VLLLQVRSIGPNVLLMSPDTRSERTINQVIPNVHCSQAAGA
jgi:hypothetical protein